MQHGAAQCRVAHRRAAQHRAVEGSAGQHRTAQGSTGQGQLTMKLGQLNNERLQLSQEKVARIV